MISSFSNSCFPVSDWPSRAVRSRPHENVLVSRVPGHPPRPTLRGILHQRHEGLSGLPRRARGELGQIHWWVRLSLGIPSLSGRPWPKAFSIHFGFERQNKTKVCRQTETNDSAKITLFCLAANASFFVCASFSNADEWGAHHKAVRIINDLLCHIFHLCPCPLSLALFHFFFIVFGYLYNALVFVPVSRCLDPEECDFTLIFCTPKTKIFSGHAK